MQTNWQIDKFVTVLEKKQVYFIILPPSICLHLIYLLRNLRSSSSPKIHFYCYCIFMYYILDTAT